MANIIDYINWRGDLDFIQSPFNEIDNLILSRVAYFPFDEIIKYGEAVKISSLYSRFEKTDISKAPVLQKEDLDLFPVLANSRRYGNLLIKWYVNKRDLIEEKQFSAITVLIPDKTVYVSYRGTDNTLVGWKEDFNLSFMEYIPAQRSAVEYLNMVAQGVSGKLRVGGHSKGGNLAIYASAFCNREVQDRIIEVYNNDGPGFLEKVLETENYKRILDRVHTYMPQTSIIGRILNHREVSTIVKSTQVGIYQHDLYSWQLLGSTFIGQEELTKESEFVDKTLTKWLDSLSMEQKQKFWMVVFEILESTEAKTLSEISSNWFESSKKILETYKSLDDDSKGLVIETARYLIKVIKENIKQERSGDRLINQPIRLSPNFKQ